MRIVLVVHDIRSCHNVGSLLRTADGFGLDHVYLTGYTPYPEHKKDSRLPHLRRKIATQIHKTALGAEQSVPWSQADEVEPLLDKIKAEGYTIVALEQASNSIPLPEFHPTQDVALLIGREVEGLAKNLLENADYIVEIPMFGQKESFNVVQAAAMALYQCRFSAQK